MGILYKHDLAHKEVVEINAFVEVDEVVGLLLVGQRDVEPHGGSPDGFGASVGGFHDSRTASADDSVAFGTESLGNAFGHLVPSVVLRKSGGAKNAHARPDPRQAFVGIHEFAHYFKNGPGIVGANLGP